MHESMLLIKPLRVKHGDAIVIEITDSSKKIFRMLVDGGPPGSFSRVNHPGMRLRRAEAFVDQLNAYHHAGWTFDLTVLTHYDSDHIGGFLAAYRREAYRKIIGKNLWFNSAALIAKAINRPYLPQYEIKVADMPDAKTSLREAIDLDKLVEAVQKDRILISDESPVLVFNWGTISILSPTMLQLIEVLDSWEIEQDDRKTSAHKNDYAEPITQLQKNIYSTPDKSVPNGSSIAMLLKAEAGSMLLLGDAYSNTICDGIRKIGYSEQKKLVVNACKISHHGSKANTCEEFLSLIESEYFIFSTNGGKQLPHKQTVARILKFFPDAKLYFNYPEIIRQIFSDEELKEYSGNIVQASEITICR